MPIVAYVLLGLLWFTNFLERIHCGGVVASRGFTALLADEEFLLAKPSSLARLDGQAIPRPGRNGRGEWPRCTGDGAPCGGQGRGT